MPYNVIASKDDRSIITHCGSPQEALEVLEMRQTNGFVARVVSVEGAELSMDRLQLLAGLHVPNERRPQAA